MDKNNVDVVILLDAVASLNGNINEGKKKNIRKYKIFY